MIPISPSSARKKAVVQLLRPVRHPARHAKKNVILLGHPARTKRAWRSGGGLEDRSLCGQAGADPER
jgi:hypothetical protein